jgi:hypothetical protein
MASADDVYWFPNVVGPICQQRDLFRVRRTGSVDSAIKDTWVLETPRQGGGGCPAPLLRRLACAELGRDHAQNYENVTRASGCARRASRACG